MSDERAIEAVRLAIMAAGQHDRGWRQRVASIVPEVAALLRPPQDENVATSPVVTARKVAESSVFTAEYVSHELEESSKRLLVRFRSETANSNETDGDGLEELRSEPLWTPAGRIMRTIVDGLSPGQRCTVFKHIERIPGNKKVRVLVHLQPHGRAQSSPSARPAGAGVERTAPESSPPDSGAVDEAHAGRINALSSAIDDLPGPKMVRFARACRDAGIDQFKNPPFDRLDEVEALLKEVQA